MVEIAGSGRPEGIPQGTAPAVSAGAIEGAGGDRTITRTDGYTLAIAGGDGYKAVAAAVSSGRLWPEADSAGDPHGEPAGHHVHSV